MSKTIIVPTDFQVASLLTLKLALQANPDEQMNVILLHGRFLSSSISDLLFFSPKDTITKMVTPQFNDALAIIENSFRRNLKGHSIEIFNGTSHSAFRNFIEAREVHAFYIPARLRLKIPKGSFDLLPYISRSGLPVHIMNWDLPQNMMTRDQLEIIFNQQ